VAGLAADQLVNTGRSRQALATAAHRGIGVTGIGVTGIGGIEAFHLQPHHLA